MFVRDSARRSAPWKKDVAWAAAGAMADQQIANGGGLLEGPLSVAMVFTVARPKSHYGKNGVRPSAPLYPTTRPDVLKLARAVEDACTGVVWRDDAQIVLELIAKEYGEPVRVHVSVRSM